MSDVRPPPGEMPEPESETPHEAGGLWHRYRSLPVPLQILAPLVVVAVIVVAVVWATSGSDGDDASSDTTTASGDTALAVVVKGLIVTGALAESSEPTTEAPASTSEPTSTPTTPPPATTAEAPTTPSITSTSPTTTSATSVPATTAPAATVAPTSSPPTTKPTPTTPPTTAPEVTEPPDTTEAPTTTAGVSAALPSVAAFFDNWDDAASGTDVPTISKSEAKELTGDYAGYYLIPLTAGGSTLPPQVGLVGTVTKPGSGQLGEVALVWIPGSDEDSSAFYWKCFSVLVQAVSPGATPDEISRLASDLDEGPDTPPFDDTAKASSAGLDYQSFTLPYTGKGGPLDVSAIEVS